MLEQLTDTLIWKQVLYLIVNLVLLGIVGSVALILATLLFSGVLSLYNSVRHYFRSEKP